MQRYLFVVRSTFFRSTFTTLADTTLELGRIGIFPNGQNDFANGMQIFCATNILICGIIWEIRDFWESEINSGFGGMQWQDKIN